MNFHWHGTRIPNPDGSVYTSAVVEIYLCDGPRTCTVERNHILEGGDSGWTRYFERQTQTIKKDGDPEKANWYDACTKWT